LSVRAGTNRLRPVAALLYSRQPFWLKSLQAPRLGIISAGHLYQMTYFPHLLHLALVAVFASARAWAQTQDAAEIQRTVEAFVHTQAGSLPGRLEVSQGAIDPRLKLARCERLDAFLPRGARLWGNATVGVRCERPEKWKLFVPVQVRVWADVVVSARALTRGQPLAAGDLAVQNLDLTQLPRGIYTDPNPLTGKIVNAQIAGGTPLRPDMLRAPAVVVQGQIVQVVFMGESVRVSSEGRALANAGAGEWVSVRTASGKVLKGIVQSPGVVEVH
jgi:flagellar basal body P-ring formation protein FlgA